VAAGLRARCAYADFKRPHHRQAAALLCGHELSVAALFMITGTETDEAVVLEHSGPEAAKRKMRNGVLAAANHYETKAFEEYNRFYDDGWDDSQDRARYAKETAATASKRRASPAERLKILGRQPVNNELTAQRMYFCAKTGDNHILCQN
jgi:hypothetical protein